MSYIRSKLFEDSLSRRTFIADFFLLWQTIDLLPFVYYDGKLLENVPASIVYFSSCLSVSSLQVIDTSTSRGNQGKKKIPATGI
jgi:hypothetical protein